MASAPVVRTGQIGVRTKNGRKAACPGGDALDLCPAAWEEFLEERLGEPFGP